MCTKLEAATYSCILSSTFLLRSRILVRPFMCAHTSQHTELWDQNFVALKLHEMPTFIQVWRIKSCILATAVWQKITPCIDNLHHDIRQKTKNVRHSYKKSLQHSKHIIMATCIPVGLFYSCPNLFQNLVGFRRIVWTGVVSNGVNSSNGHLLTGVVQAPCLFLSHHIVHYRCQWKQV